MYNVQMEKFTILTAEEIKNQLNDMSHWQELNGELHTQYTFANFQTAIAVMTLVGFVAEKLQHHPTMVNTYNKVSFTMNTHDAGNKITSLDFEMVKEIDAIARRLGDT